jgi:hypothetical protein
LKKLLATATILGVSLFTFGAGSASAANCPFTSGLQNPATKAVAQQPNFSNCGQFGNLFQQFFSNTANDTQNVPTQQFSNLPVQQSYCPFK